MSTKFMMSASSCLTVIWTPRFHLLCFVCGVVIHDDVNIKVTCDLGIDFLQESQKLLRPMAFAAFADDKTGSNIKGCKQGRRAMADVIMGLAFRYARHHDLLFKIASLIITQGQRNNRTPTISSYD